MWLFVCGRCLRSMVYGELVDGRVVFACVVWVVVSLLSDTMVVRCLSVVYAALRAWC